MKRAAPKLTTTAIAPGKQSAERVRAPDRWAVIYFLFYAAVAIVMWLVFSRAMLDKPDGIYTGVLNNYGDLPFHISVITRFAFGQNFPPEDPTFAGARFTYPFMTDFISAMFVRAGASLRDSLFIENYIVGVALVGVLHRFGQQLLRNRTAALLTPVLVISKRRLWLGDAVQRSEPERRRRLSGAPAHSAFVHDPSRSRARAGVGATPSPACWCRNADSCWAFRWRRLCLRNGGLRCEAAKKEKVKGKRQKGRAARDKQLREKGKQSGVTAEFFPFYFFLFTFAFSEADARRRRRRRLAAADSRAQFHRGDDGWRLSGAN